ncbi:putative sulfate exporter family transporter [Paludibacter sp.]
MGIVYAQFFEHPLPQANKKLTNLLLRASVVGLGFGLNANAALQAGKEGLLLTIGSIAIVLIIGFLIGKTLKVDKVTSFLISGGTAICGGSAIAALSPVVRAKESQISVALGVIFILNSVALFVFPFIGHQLNLSQNDFGLWSAVAIHDTSSVVGAASRYGDEALVVATTVKLARTLWIIPIVILSTFIFRNKEAKIKIPYFIGFFIIAIICNTYIPGLNSFSPYLVKIAKVGLTLTLFLIGTSLSAKLIKTVGVQPIIQGLVLWVLISVGSLLAILWL